MKSNVLTTLLHGALAFSVLFSMMFCIRLIVVTRNIHMLNAQLQRVNATRSTVEMMVSDCVKYSKRNPAIDPLLMSYRLLPGSDGTSSGNR